VKDVQDILTTLFELKPFLMEKFNVSSIGIFGSVARREQVPGSDIDIIVDFTKPIGIEFVDLADYLESQLNNNVDVVSVHGIKEKYLQAIEPDIIYV
jgi:predicted nucleotidyltransferase